MERRTGEGCCQALKTDKKLNCNYCTTRIYKIAKKYEKLCEPLCPGEMQTV